MKYEAAFAEFFAKQLIFDINDARRFLFRLGASEAYIRLMLHNLVQDGKLQRIGKGTYSYNRNESLIGFKFRPFHLVFLWFQNQWTDRNNSDQEGFFQHLILEQKHHHNLRNHNQRMLFH